MTKRTRPDTRGTRPAADGRIEPARTLTHRGRRIPAPTGTAPVARSGVPARRFDVAGPVVAYDPPTADHVTRQAVAPDGTVGAPRGTWERLGPDLRPDTVPADGSNAYGRGRTATVGATSRARSERRRQAAVAASRIDAARIAARVRADADAARKDVPRARRARPKR